MFKYIELIVTLRRLKYVCCDSLKDVLRVGQSIRLQTYLSESLQVHIKSILVVIIYSSLKDVVTVANQIDWPIVVAYCQKTEVFTCCDSLKDVLRVLLIADQFLYYILWLLTMQAEMEEKIGLNAVFLGKLPL